MWFYPNLEFDGTCLADEAVHGLCILGRLFLTLNEAARRRGRVQVQLVKVTCGQYKESSGEPSLTDTQVQPVL